MTKATKDSVLAAVAECNELGVDAFLAQHGYRKSLRFVLVIGGREYPSKAILGVARGLTARQFSGGAAHTVRTLVGLGFDVRKVG